MSTQAMPDKWAVKIESEAEAKDLQAFFPDARIAYSGYDLVFCWIIKHIPYPDFCLYPYGIRTWNYGTCESRQLLGYTIYTTSQLKELLK